MTDQAAPGIEPDSDPWYRAEADAAIGRMGPTGRIKLERLTEATGLDWNQFTGRGQRTLAWIADFDVVQGLVEVLTAVFEHATEAGYEAGFHDRKRADEGVSFGGRKPL